MVSEIPKPRGAAGNPRAALNAEEDLRRELDHYYAIVNSAEDAIISKDLDGVITSWNAGAQRIFGYTAEEAVGKPVTLLIPTDRHNEEPVILERIRRGEHIEHYETVRQRKDGTLIDISLTVSPVRDRSGVVTGASKIARDITERTRAERLVTTLAREAEHRTKNILMTVLATIHLSDAPTAKELKELIAGRIQALADVHALFVQSRWAGADARKIVEQELAPFGELDDSRVSLVGPAEVLAPEAAQALAVTIHELATNAAKYGALSIDQGKLSVEWAVASERRIELRWVETAGPAVKAPAHRGFGTRAMSGMIAARGGSLDFAWKRGGLQCEIVIPI